MTSTTTSSHPAAGPGQGDRSTQATASVAAILAESAARFPDDVAVIVGDRRTT